MKQLRQYIRRILLTEGMKTATDLPDHVVVVIKQTNEAYFMVYYADEDSPEIVAIKGIRGVPISGRITMGKSFSDRDGNCDGALKVGNANALHGWGPLLYDVAMEHATQVANGLFPDRASVSKDAEGVWNYYLGNRGDVTAHQLDNLENELTPEIEEDNCSQFVSQVWAGRRNIKDWTSSPLSKRYTKEPTTINALKAAGKLVML